jgi:GT2 family glycosyltransferase
VAVILVNWNSWRESVECIDSLLAQQHSDFHVFLVDNQSGDGSVEAIAAWCASPRAEASWRRLEGVDRITDRTPGCPIAYRLVDRPEEALPATPGPPLTLIRSGANLGFAGGCNVGIRAAGIGRFDFFWLLNTDTVVDRSALAALTRRASSDDGLGLVGSTIRYYDRPDVVQSLGGARMELATMTSRLIGEGDGLEVVPVDGAAVEQQMAYVMGASMLVSNRFVREVGPLQEDYFLYYEEIDWAVRGRGRFRLGYAPESHVFHKSGASSSQIMPLFTANLYYRNRLRFVSRFFPHRLAAAKRGLAVDLLRHTLKGRWGHARIVASALWDAQRLGSDMRADSSKSS